MDGRTGRNAELAPATARWLVSDAGRQRVAAAARRLDDGADALAVASWLRSEGVDHAPAAATSEAAFARVRARQRWPQADELLLTRLGLEQASDPAVSRWRAGRFAGADRVVDLAAGVGGDTIALGRVGPEVVAVDHDEARLLLLRHNARVHGLEPLVVAGDAVALPLRRTPLVHVDPGRRRGRARARRLADYQPPVLALRELLASAEGAAVVVSPAVDLDDPDLPAGEIEFVQVGWDLVEAVVWIGALAADGPRSATILEREGSHRLARDGRVRLPVGDVGEWLVEVAPAAVRARLHDELGVELSAHRLARTRALLTASQRPPPSPWWRASRVEAVLTARPKKVREWLRARSELPVELVVHGMDVDVDRWWQRLGRPPRGWGGRVLHLVRTDEGGSCIVTAPPERDT